MKNAIAMDDVPYTTTGTPDPSGLQGKPIRRRNRMINSCLECRKRKLKCSKTSPICTNCGKSGRDCLYIGPRLDVASQLRLTEIKEKQGTLERELERDIAKSTTKSCDPSQRLLADEVDGNHDEEGDLEATPLVALDVAYEDDEHDTIDNLVDLGIQIGKMRITERIGGLSRPRIAEEIEKGISKPHRPDSSSNMPGYTSQRYETPVSDCVPDFTELPQYLQPGEDYLVPSSGFYFGQVPTIGEGGVDFEQLLLPRQLADKLMGHYFKSVHWIAPCTHGPALKRTYEKFWWMILMEGHEPAASTQALIFATWFSAVVSMDEQMVFTIFKDQKKRWIETLKSRTEYALSKANFLRTTRIETLQAFIVYMLPLCRAEVSRAHAVLVASAVRAAECMGLHRDGSKYGLSPVDTQVRRLVWHQLCFLDIRTCEAQGPRPIIRKEDYDTELPLNCNETDFRLGEIAPMNSQSWTSTTLILIRFEINEMMRSIWLDRYKLENRKTTLTAVLGKVERFRRRMSERYDQMLDIEDPEQRYARVVMYLLTYRLHVMVLHPYHANAAVAMPRKLSNVLITSGVLLVELAMQLETNVNFLPWRWYIGAYFQYQVALLLATEVYFSPQSGEADRIWRCLNYVFGLDPRLTPEAKSLRLLGEISERTKAYMGLRKMRLRTEVSRARPAQYAVAGTLQAQQYSRPSTTSSFEYQQPSPAPTTPGSNGLGYQPSVPSHQAYHYIPQHQQHPVTSPSVPPAPVMQYPEVVFAGVCDGQPLYSVPPPQHNSPESDTNATEIATVLPIGSTEQSSIMDDIDWDIINGLFPADPQTGVFSAQGFLDPTFDILCDWHPQKQQMPPQRVPSRGYQ